MIKSVVQLRTVPMPFSIENVLTARVDLPRADYPDSPASIRFFEQLLPQLRAVPGVEAATLSDGFPAAGNGSIPVQIAGKAYPQASDYPLAREGIVTAGVLRDVPDDGRRAAASSIPATAPRVSRSRSSTTRSRARTSPARIRSDGSSGASVPARRTLADRRRPGAGPADGGHRQQRREPGRLLHPDRAERCRQRRPDRGPHRVATPPR